MNKLISLAAVFGMTIGLANAGEHPFADWDRIESEISPTGYVAASGTPATVQDHVFADWHRVEAELHPTGQDLEGQFADNTEPRYGHPGVGQRNMSASRIGNIEYNS